MAQVKMPNLRETLSKIEAISRVLKLTGLKVDMRKKIACEAYVPEYDNTLYLYTGKGEEITSLHVGHEVFHHYQELNGQLLKRGSKEEEEYINHVDKMRDPKNLHIAWTHYKWAHELQAEVFGWVFAERYAQYKRKRGRLSDSGLDKELAIIVNDARLKNFRPEARPEVEKLQAKMNEMHDKFIEQYADLIDKALEAVNSEKRDIYGFSFELIA